jgi:hypothetical protein
VIDLLTKYFVPVQVGTTDVLQKSDIEQSEYEKAMRGTLEGGFNIVDIDGKCVDRFSRGTTDQLIRWLKGYAEQRHLQPRNREESRANKERSLPVPKSKTEKSLLLHSMTASSDDDLGVAHDWIDLAPAEWACFVPRGSPEVGLSREIPVSIANKLYVYFYPPISDFSSSMSMVLNASLRATVLSASRGEIQLELDGSVTMVHDQFVHSGLKRPPPATVRAKLIGVATFDVVRKEFTSFQMASTDAVFSFSYMTRGQAKRSDRKFVIGVEQETRR